MLALSENEWLAEQISGISERVSPLRPSEVAEKYRYLPPSTTNIPGPYRFETTPFLREIVDCFSVDSDVRHVSVMKGVQVGYTVGCLENVLLYYIREVRTAPVLFATADKDLSDLRIQTNIVPMILSSGIEDLIQSSDRLSKRKQGKTAWKIEWAGGGYLVPIGAQSTSKMSSLPFPCLLRDELDRWPLKTPDGDPEKITFARTKTYEDVRKVLDGSTPTIKGISKIDDLFKRGDQRRYFFRCFGCGEAQTMWWSNHNQETGEVSGVVWETQDEEIVKDSVRYLCRFCQREHFEQDKPRMLGFDNAEWRPTARPLEQDHRSYHVPALISLVQSWYQCAIEYREAVGRDPGAPNDLGKLQVFYNNVLAEPFELIGQRVSFQAASSHRRIEYAMGTVPSRYAERVTGSPILLLTAAVDVGVDKLWFAVFGWTRGLRAWLIDYQVWEGNTGDIDDPATWGRLAHQLEQTSYPVDGGGEMALGFVVVDASYLSDQCYRFCAQFVPAPIFAIRGRDEPLAGATMPFSKFPTPYQAPGFHVVVDFYKDRWSHALRRIWNEGTGENQPDGHFNAPVNLDDLSLKELTVEYKIPRKKGPGAGKGYIWHRPHGVRNELWDLLVYNSAAVDIACWDVSKNALGLSGQDWPSFWEYVEAARKQ